MKDYDDGSDRTPDMYEAGRQNILDYINECRKRRIEPGVLNLSDLVSMHASTQHEASILRTAVVIGYAFAIWEAESKKRGGPS